MQNSKDNAIKLEVLKHYSPAGTPQCLNPYGMHTETITDIDLLTLDGEETKNKLGVKHIYRKLQKENYPDGYNVLCLNCQRKLAALLGERQRQYLEI